MLPTDSMALFVIENCITALFLKRKITLFLNDFHSVQSCLSGPIKKICHWQREVLSLDEESFFYNAIMPCQCSPPVSFDSSALGQGQNMSNPAQTGWHHRDENVVI